MKLRDPRLIAAASWTAARMVRLIGRTLRVRYEALGADLDPRHPNLRGRYIYVFWHEYILLPAHIYGRPDVYVLASEHADGRLIAGVARHLGFRAVYGSSTRGGVKAVRELMRLADKAHVTVMPDGPRGPRREVKTGVVYLASRTGMPIVPFGFGLDRPWRVKSWDRFAIPRPFTRAAVVSAEAIVVPPDADSASLERYRRRVQERLDYANDLAERLAARGLTSRRAAA
jgi:lysophospholipid acyltransferase (LPLAT)-like uncharacterized protein